MSGLSRTPGKRVWANPHRGFESRPLRQRYNPKWLTLLGVFSWLCGLARPACNRPRSATGDNAHEAVNHLPTGHTLPRSDRRAAPRFRSAAEQRQDLRHSAGQQNSAQGAKRAICRLIGEVIRELCASGQWQGTRLPQARKPEFAPPDREVVNTPARPKACCPGPSDLTLGTWNRSNAKPALQETSVWAAVDAQASRALPALPTGVVR